MRDIILPHREVLHLSGREASRLPLAEVMAKIRGIRDYIGEKKDHWFRAGLADGDVPEAQKEEIRDAERIGLRLFDAIQLPLSYRRNSRLELSATLRDIERDAIFSRLTKQWGQIDEDEQSAILYRLCSIFADRQASNIPQIEIIPARVKWVSEVPFEGNAVADYLDNPQDYIIELNAGKDGRLRINFKRAALCALHEQTHIKQTCYAHAYKAGTLPPEFERVAEYMIEQKSAYIPAWRSSKLWAAQPCEKEALMATNATLRLE